MQSLVLLSVIIVVSMSMVNGFHDDVVDLTCIPCPPNHYCENGQSFSCPNNTYTLGSASSIEECLCDLVYCLITMSVYLACPFYYDDGIQYSCEGNRETLLPGQSTAESCVCKLASLRMEAECGLCGPGTFSSQDRQSCLNCPVNSNHDEDGASDVQMQM